MKWGTASKVRYNEVTHVSNESSWTIAHSFERETVVVVRGGGGVRHWGMETPTIQ